MSKRWHNKAKSKNGSTAVAARPTVYRFVNGRIKATSPDQLSPSKLETAGNPAYSASNGGGVEKSPARYSVGDRVYDGTAWGDVRSVRPGSGFGGNEYEVIDDRGLIRVVPEGKLRKSEGDNSAVAKFADDVAVEGFAAEQKANFLQGVCPTNRQVWAAAVMGVFGMATGFKPMAIAGIIGAIAGLKDWLDEKFAACEDPKKVGRELSQKVQFAEFQVVGGFYKGGIFWPSHTTGKEILGSVYHSGQTYSNVLMDPKYLKKSKGGDDFEIIAKEMKAGTDFGSLHLRPIRNPRAPSRDWNAMEDYDATVLHQPLATRYRDTLARNQFSQQAGRPTYLDRLAMAVTSHPALSHKLAEAQQYVGHAPKSEQVREALKRMLAGATRQDQQVIDGILAELHAGNVGSLTVGEVTDLASRGLLKSLATNKAEEIEEKDHDAEFEKIAKGPSYALGSANAQLAQLARDNPHLNSSGEIDRARAVLRQVVNDPDGSRAQEAISILTPVFRFADNSGTRQTLRTVLQDLNDVLHDRSKPLGRGGLAVAASLKAGGKGDFSITNYQGQKLWFSDWIEKLSAIIDREGPLSSKVTHFMLVDAFKNKETPEHFYQTQRTFGKSLKSFSDIPNYRTADDPARCCETCAFFESGNRCTMYDAEVRPEMVCDSWAATKSKSFKSLRRVKVFRTEPDDSIPDPGSKVVVNLDGVGRFATVEEVQGDKAIVVTKTGKHKIDLDAISKSVEQGGTLAELDGDVALIDFDDGSRGAVSADAMREGDGELHGPFESEEKALAFAEGLNDE